MKTVRNFFGVLMVVMMLVATDGFAQGRGNGNRDNHPGKGHDKNKHGKHDRGNDRYDWDHNDRSREYSVRHDRHRIHDRHVTYRHHRNGPPSWAPAYGYRYNTRYIYYRDYNVYYDCHRDVFVTWTGRNWSVSTRIPVVMAHVDFRRASVMGVEYWDDDFDFYLERRRPAYVSIRASF